MYDSGRSAPPTPHAAQVSAQKAEPVAKVKQETLPSTVFLMPRTDRPSGNKPPPSSILLLLGRATHSSPRLTFQDTTRSRAGRAAELRGNTFLLALAAPLRAQGALREPRPRAMQPPRRCCARSHRRGREHELSGAVTRTDAPLYWPEWITTFKDKKARFPTCQRQRVMNVHDVDHTLVRSHAAPCRVIKPAASSEGSAPGSSCHSLAASSLRPGPQTVRWGQREACPRALLSTKRQPSLEPESTGLESSAAPTAQR